MVRKELDANDMFNVMLQCIIDLGAEKVKLDRDILKEELGLGDSKLEKEEPICTAKEINALQHRNEALEEVEKLKKENQVLKMNIGRYKKGRKNKSNAEPTTDTENRIRYLTTQCNRFRKEKGMKPLKKWYGRNGK